MYGTGIGDLTVLPTTGSPSPENPPATAKLTATAKIGGVTAPVSFAGLTPDAIGLAQFDIQVPQDLPAGSTLPLIINFSAATSTPVNLAVQSGKASANLIVKFSPNPVPRRLTEVGPTTYKIQETNGVGVTLTKLLTVGADQTNEIKTWFGTNHIPPMEAQVAAASEYPVGILVCPPYVYSWQLTGDDDSGHTGLSWTAVLQLAALSPEPGIGTMVYGLDPAARGLAVDSLTNIYWAENNSIKRISPSGTIMIIAGNGTPGFSGDGGPATSAQLYTPLGVAVDTSGVLYIADYYNGRIRRVDSNGTISTFAGNGINIDAGDGGLATSASFAQLENVATDADGNVYVITALTVRKIDKNGIVTTVAGDSSCLGGGFRGDGGPAPAACLYVPDGVAFKPDGIYIADGLNLRVRRVDANDNITTFAGNGQRGFSGDGGSAIQAAIDWPSGIAADESGNVFISSCSEQRIRVVSSSGVISTVVGTGIAGFGGDNAAPSDAQLNCPVNLALGPDGALYVLDSSNQRIRRIVLSSSP